MGNLTNMGKQEIFNQFAVIGDPIEHSLSPILHNEVFRQINLKADYSKLFVENGNLENAINSRQIKKLTGFNITIPHKKEILKYLDFVNPRAVEIGSINCVFNKNNQLWGFNTDWFGFSMLMKRNNINLNDHSIILIGSGGVARAIIFSLKNLGVKSINMLNRNLDNAMEFKDDVISAYSLNIAHEIIKTNSIIINATPVGMKNDDSPIDVSLIHQDQVIVDIIYTPLETTLLKIGKQIGAKTINGLDMFIEQGLASLDLWFGSSISKKVNFTQLKAYLGSQLC